MSLRVWDERVVPRLADLSLRGHDVGDLRGRVCEGLAGDVLEVGFGSGLNVRWYPPTVASVTAIEPSDVGWAMSQRRRERSQVPVRRGGVDGQAIDVPTDSHDGALLTFSLCTIPDAMRALQEIRRVVRPGGALHFLEHGVSPDDGVRRWQQRLEPLQRSLGGGCHLTRRPLELVETAGWTTTWAEQEYLPGPRFMRPWTRLTFGVAR